MDVLASGERVGRRPASKEFGRQEKGEHDKGGEMVGKVEGFKTQNRIRKKKNPKMIGSALFGSFLISFNYLFSVVSHLCLWRVKAMSGI